MTDVMSATNPTARPLRLRIWQRLAGPLDRWARYSRMHETLIVTAIATILVIRTQLWLTNYPQLGGHGLHIAHLLWGGLFMLVAIALLVTFLGTPARRQAAVVGGVGFGFFIDELGKFITADNDYFYRPTPALIYLIFLGLYALANWAAKRDGLTPREALVNAIDLLAEAACGRLDERQRANALALLEQADQDHPLVPRLRAIMREVSALPTRGPSRPERWAAAVHAWFVRLAARPRFATGLAVVFGIWAVLALLATVELTLSLVLRLGGAHPDFVSDAIEHLQLHNWVGLASSAVSALLVLGGIARLRRGDRLGGLRRFERALLVAILVTQVCSFVESQFGAVFQLAIALILLAGVRQLMSGERQRAALQARSAAPPPSAGSAADGPSPAGSAAAGTSATAGSGTPRSRR